MEVLLFLFWIPVSIGIGFLANSRGRSGVGFFFLSLLLSPLLGLLIVLVTEDLNHKVEMAKDAERDHQRRLEEVRALTAAPPKPALTEPVQSVSSIADELTKLADLKSKGVLTDEEFSEQKRRLLNPGGSSPGKVETAVAREVPMGSCSHCRESIPLQSASCPKCSALFGPSSIYRVEA